MKSIDIKKLFWKIVNVVYDCSDTWVVNTKGAVTEKGMNLSNGYSVLYGL
ncbi:MAG: hypothetical protein RR128_08445 [Clostridium sp.]